MTRGVVCTAGPMDQPTDRLTNPQTDRPTDQPADRLMDQQTNSTFKFNKENLSCDAFFFFFRLPQTIYNKFASKFQVTKFRFYAAWSNYAPSKFTFFGSNAEDCEDQEKWDLQVSYKNPHYNSHNGYGREVENPNKFR